VLVYYAHSPALITRLQEFGAASRETIFMGTWMVSGGLLLIILYFVSKRFSGDSDEHSDADEDEDKPGPDVIHIVPPN